MAVDLLSASSVLAAPTLPAVECHDCGAEVEQYVYQPDDNERCEACAATECDRLDRADYESSRETAIEVASW